MQNKLPKPKSYSMQKKLLSLFSLLFFTIACFAQKSSMIFFTPNEEKFYLVVNGIQQNGQALPNVKITEMAAPMQYNVKIKFEDSKLGVINDKVSLEPGTEKSWKIQPKKKKGSTETEMVIKVAGEIPLDNIATSNTFPEEQVIVYHTEPLPNANADGVSFNMNVNEQGGSVSFNVNDRNSSSYSSTATTTTQTVSGTTNATIGNCSNPMDAIAFRQQLDRVRSQSTAAGRKIIAEKIAQSSCLTAQQVYELCDALYMSSDKLALAKYCYTRCYDPNNYEEVYKALPTSSMVKELDDYVTRTSMPSHQNPASTTTVPVRIEYVPGYNGPYGCAQPMATASFASAKSTIQDADFENTKMSTAKTIVGANCLTTDQIVELCRLFDFENSKLEFAKFAYSHAYDKGNYFKVNKVFDFDASKEDLNKYVQGR